MQFQKVELLESGQHLVQACLEFEVASSCTMRLICKPLGDNIKVKDADLFSCMVKIRKKLERKNIVLLCKGAQTNVYPSGMCRDMGRGRKAYTLEYGKHPDIDDLVDILEPATVEQVATVLEQEKFFQEWIESINPGQPATRGDTWFHKLKNLFQRG